VTDGNKESYWATDDDVTSGQITIDLKASQTIKYVVLQEYLKLGQRVKSFEIDVRVGKSWKRIAEGTTIGYKRILKVDPVKSQIVRVTIKSAKACPAISNIEVY
jgi:alpha-L-fucosidase